MWDTLLDALIDSLKVLPILFLAYVLIEVIEEKTSKTIENSRFLHGKYAPLVGSAIGLIPQCGFSVIATDMYTKKQINIGTLLAMYIATSDEAIPILISYPDQYVNLLIILAIKFVIGVIVGYITNLTLKYIIKPSPVFVGNANAIDTKNYKTKPLNAGVNHNYLMGEVGDTVEAHHSGCCGHAVEDKDKSFWRFIYHPILHSLKIFAFILAVNVVFGVILYYVGEDVISSALNSALYFQPLIASLVGLIPNCASSVIITKIFAMGGLSLGACIAGLMANAGIGLAVLIRQNRPRKNTIYIILTLYLVSAMIGTIVTLIA